MPTSRAKSKTRSISSLQGLPEIEVNLRSIPYYALTPYGNPELTGRIYLGKSPEDALINARADLDRHYKGIAKPKITV
jgi:hypothetical protein